MPSPSTLLLVPTALERAELERHGLGGAQLIGFGPIAAAGRTAQLLAERAPERVLLCGIAGSFDPEDHPVGAARFFQAVLSTGVGAGQGAAFRSAGELGFPQWPGEGGAPSIGESLPLHAPTEASGSAAPALLTAPSASASPEEAARRRERHPAAAAEDLEGFGVALACALAAKPLCIVRGLSNAVGERGKDRWRIPEALAAAAELAARAREASWRAGVGLPH